MWRADAAVGKTVVSTSLIDRIAARLGRKLCEVPVGFKWFSAGLLDGSLGFGGEESAGASFLRRDGKVWTTDKDGLVPALLAAEITARCGRDPAQIYAELVQQLGEPVADRVEAAAMLPTRSKASPRYIIDPWRKGRRSSRPARAATAPSASPAFRRHTPSQCSVSPGNTSSSLALSLIHI